MCGIPPFGNRDAGVALPLSPGTGSPPSIQIASIADPVTGDVVADYTISDQENNPVSLRADYSSDQGTLWKKATVEGDTLDITFDAYAGSLLWKSGLDLPGQDVPAAWLRITPRDHEAVDGTPDTLIVHIDNRPPDWIAASGSAGDDRITVWFNEPVADSTATLAANYTLDQGLTISSVTVAAVNDTFTLHLGSGQTLPLPPQSVIVSATNIRDLLGNLQGTTLDTAFTPTTGEPPTIELEWPWGVQQGDLRIGYRIDDPESNQVFLNAHYSIDDGLSWLPATVSGAVNGIASTDYDSALTWQSSADLGAERIEDVWLRVTPRDNDVSSGVADSVRVSLDNESPQWIAAIGSSGDSTFQFWFSEPVEQAGATNLSNYSLSDGLTGESISPLEVNSWTNGATAPSRRHSAAAGVIGGRLYVAGGFFGSPVPTLEVYDPSTDRWSVASPLNVARAFVAGAVVGGRLYAIGGYDGSGPVPTVEVYDPVSDTWNPAPPLPTARYGAAAEVIAGRLYVAGGVSGGYKNVLEIYDPQTGEWSTGTSMPTARAYMSAGVIDNRLYLAGGKGIAGNLNTLEVYDPATDSWSTATAMPTGRAYSAGGVIDDKLYVAGGEAGSLLDVLEVFDPASGNWSPRTALRLANRSMAAGAVQGRLLLVGGAAALDTLETYTALPSRFEYELTSGQTLPPPPTIVTLSATGISDRFGNTTPAALDTAFSPGSGELPSITLQDISGTVSGDVAIDYVISDAEDNVIALHADYSQDSGSSWQTATVSGDTSGITSGGYSGSLTWHSRTDLPGIAEQGLLFRITPRDNETVSGQSDRITLDLGDKTFEFAGGLDAPPDSPLVSRYVSWSGSACPTGSRSLHHARASWHKSVAWTSF